MRLAIAAAALAMASPAWGAHYKIVLDRPANGRLILGHMGLQAADERTEDTFVRVVAPGNIVDVRGTVRVMVMNLGPKAFTFGPDQVTVRLGDGTVLKPTPVEAFEKRKDAAELEQSHARAIDLVNRNSMSSLVDGAKASAPGEPAVIPEGHSADTAGNDFQSDEDLLPHSEVLNAIYQLLIPLTVKPQQAWGGYYVFDVPRDVQRRKADQPLTISVRTGVEEHRFSGTLRWK